MELQQFKTLSVDQIVEAFHRLHGKENQERTVFNVWLHAVEHASSVGEALRKDEYTEAFCAIARVFGWLCSFVAKCYYDEKAESVFKLNRRLSEIVWNKYPRMCYACVTFPCHCMARKREVEKVKRITPDQEKLLASARELGQPPSSLDGWAQMFEAIYGNYHYASSLVGTGFHFLEEVGEVAKSVVDLQEKEAQDKSGKLIRTAEDEIADVFSWLFAVVLKLRYISESVAPLLGVTKTIELSTIVWKAYEEDLRTL